MSVNVNTVTVKNKLGNRYGYREIQVSTWANDQITGNITISPGGEESIHPLGSVFQHLDSIEIEALGLGTNQPIPVSIEPPGGLDVDVSCEIEDKRWKIIFTPPINNLKSTGSDVNVTLGQDEPESRSLFFMPGVATGLIVGPLFYRISPILWGAAVLIALAGAAAAWFRSPGRKRKKQESESKETIE